MTTTPEWIHNTLIMGWGLLFRYPSNKKAARWSWVLLGLLFLAGVFWWGTFYHWGRYPMDYQDWIDVSAPRFFFLRDAVMHLVLPLHMTEKSLLGWATTRFMAVPDAFLSPQIVFLRNLSVERFIFLNMVGMYSLGFLGLLWLRKRFTLSLAAFILLFFLFNFNGHILAHLSIGHETWGGYFLFPWFVILMMDLLDGDRSWAWVAKVSLLLFFILLQGSYHQYVWALFWLGFMSVTRKSNFLPALKAAVATVLLSAVRLLPVTLEMGVFNQTFHGGYLGIIDILKSLIIIRAPNEMISSPHYLKVLGGWEFTLYIGLAGLLFLAFFGIYRWLANRGSGKSYHALLVPMLGTLLLSFNDVYFLLHKIPFPMLSGERVPARIISLPFVFLLVIASIEFQRWVNEGRLRDWLRPAVWATLTSVTIYSLWQNLVGWSILQAQPLFEHDFMFYSKWVIAYDNNDTIYFQALVAGAAISVLTLGVLIGLVLHERQQPGRVPLGGEIHPANL